MAQTTTHEISLTRVFDAPPELVYRAFVDPDQLCQWFGPEGFSVPYESVHVDARPSGYQRLVMVSDGGGLREANPAFLYVYVADADETYRRAIKAGAVAVEEPVDMPYGDRRAMVRDSWGNLWQMATRRV